MNPTGKNPENPPVIQILDGEQEQIAEDFSGLIDPSILMGLLPITSYIKHFK